MEKLGLQQENSHKNDDFIKIIKKSTFFLKNRFTVNKNCQSLKIWQILSKFRGLKKRPLCIEKLQSQRKARNFFDHFLA